MENVDRQITLPTTLEEAWDLITRPDDLEAWLGDEVDLAPVPGSSGRVVDSDGTDRRLVVEEVTEGQRLSWRWWVDGDDPDATGSRVEVTLAPSPDGTLVRVVELPLAPVATATVAQASTGTSAWPHRLLHLELLVLLASAAVAV